MNKRPSHSSKYKEYNKKYQAEYLIKNRDKLNEYQREWRRRNPELVRQSKLRRRYGMSIKDYNNLFEGQHGLCAICEKPETAKLKGTIRPLAVDHNHKTGEVRGLLCDGCNRAIGFFKEDTLTINKAIEYIKKYEE